MFGLDQVSWGQFIRLLVFLLFLWYLFILIRGWLENRKKEKDYYFEQISLTGNSPDNLDPITVSADDFPSEMLPVYGELPVELPVTFYEETGLDEGYGLNLFTGKSPGKLSGLINQFQTAH